MKQLTMKQLTMKQTREAIAYLSIVDMMHVEGLAAGTINENAARIAYKAQGGRPVRYIHINSRASKANLDAIAAAVADAIGMDRWAEIVTVVTAQQPQEAQQEAPAAEAEQQPTETENAPQAATQAAEEAATDEQKEEAEPMTKYTIKPEFYDLWGAYEGSATVTAEQIADLAREWETTVSDLMDQVEEQTTETTATPAEAATAAGIIRRNGGYRERDLLNHPHEMIHGETWNEAHKVVEILAATPDPDGYRPGCAVDIVTRSIVG